MKIQDRLKQKKYYEEQTEKARLEMLRVINELDYTKSLISHQRDGIKSLEITKNKKESEVSQISILVEGLQSLLKDNHEYFYSLTEKQQETLKEISNTISSLTKRKDRLTDSISSLEGIFDQRKDIESDLKNSKSELKTTKFQTKKEIQSLEERRLFIEKEENKILEKNKEIEEVIRLLKIKEKSLNKRDKALQAIKAKMKETITSNQK